jgi:hypothetical protein
VQLLQFTKLIFAQYAICPNFRAGSQNQEPYYLPHFSHGKKKQPTYSPVHNCTFFFVDEKIGKPVALYHASPLIT